MQSLYLYQRIAWLLPEAYTHLFPHTVVTNISHSLSAIHSSLVIPLPYSSYLYCIWEHSLLLIKPQMITAFPFRFLNLTPCSSLFNLSVFTIVTFPDSWGMLSLSCISLPFLSRKGRRECRLVSPASLIFMLAFSHPHLINSGTRLAVSPHLVSLSSLPSGGFGNAMGFCHALEAGGGFLSQMLSKNHKGTHLKVKVDGQGRVSVLLKKIKHSWTEQILTTAGLSLHCAHFQTAQGHSRHSFGYILKNSVCQGFRCVILDHYVLQCQAGLSKLSFGL